MCGRESWAARLSACVLALGVAMPSTARSAGTPPLRTSLTSDWQRRALRHALAGAARRLERPRCQRLFSDFKDQSGVALQEALDAVGQTGSGFLQGWIYFADGRSQPRCADPRVLAMTQPGSRSVWICGSQFLREYRRAPGEAEVVLIHETLHALGLGEDPPTSAEISRQVVARCGS
jgi:hypothetical protein